MGFWRKLYFVLDWTYSEKDIPTAETLRIRHLVMTQIKKSKIKLKPIALRYSINDID